MANIKCEEHYCTNNINNICILESIELKKYSYPRKKIIFKQFEVLILL